jgi:hypothetical protein
MLSGEGILTMWPFLRSYFLGDRRKHANMGWKLLVALQFDVRHHFIKGIAWWASQKGGTATLAGALVTYSEEGMGHLKNDSVGVVKP